MEGHRFRLERVSGMSVTDDELLADLRRVAAEAEKDTVGQKEYRRSGAYDDSTVTRRFGSWNKALRRAGLEVQNEPGLPDERLFENLLTVWSYYGRQPRRAELALPPSQISQSPYLRKFGSWTATLVWFVRTANADDSPPDLESGGAAATPGRGPRDPSLRLRFRVLQRDRFTCQSCGASPALHPGVQLHVDHIVPWSQGGPTTFDNLRTLCDRCNLGKGARVD